MRPASLLPFLLLLLASWPHRKAFARRRKCPGSLSEDKIIRELFRNYTKKLPDSDHPDESVHVLIEMHVQDMGSLNEISADFEIDVLFTQIWHDPNLSFQNLSSQCVSNITMESRFLKDIWTPNTCIINAKRTSVHASPADNIMFILYDNGTVWINHRMSVKAPCNLDLRTFPFDTQTCTLQFESYSHNSEEVTLHWMAEPITLMKQITLPDFDMIQFDTNRETLLYPNGYWDELQASFTFKRRYGFYILQAYVPTYLTIIVSWVGFCMEPKALPARTTVGVSSLLALTLQFGNIHKNLPRVSYVKAMDVWMLGCISFVFATMIELAIVCYITRCQSSQRAKRRLAVAQMENANAIGINAGRPLSRHQPCTPNLNHHNPASSTRRSMSALLAAGGGDLPDGMQSCLEANMFGLYTGGPSRSSSMRLHTMPAAIVRNGTIPRKISSQSSLGPFLFNRRKKRRSTTTGQQDGLLLAADEQPPPPPPQPAQHQQHANVHNNHCQQQRNCHPDRPSIFQTSAAAAVPHPPPPQLVVQTATMLDEGEQQNQQQQYHHQQHIHQQQQQQYHLQQRRIGNGELRHMPKSISGDSLLSAGDERSMMSYFPDQVSTHMFGRGWLPNNGWMRGGGGGTKEDGEENWPIIQPESIDKLSIVVFPLAFTLFNLIYWWYYLSLGGTFDAQNQQTQGGLLAPSIEPSLTLTEHVVQ